MSEVYVISSGESDDDSQPEAGLGDKGTSARIDLKYHRDKKKQELLNEFDMNVDHEDGDENNLTDESSNLPSNERSGSPDVDMEPVAAAVKRKSAGRRKGKKKSNTAEKQNKKQKMTEERLVKKAAAELKKMNQPGETMKYMHVEGHPSLWSRWYMDGVPREVTATGAHVIQTPSLCNPGLLVWTRTVPRTLDSEEGQVRLSPLRQRCDRAVYIADAEEIGDMVSAHTLSPHLSEIRQLCDCKLTLLVCNVHDYFKKQGRGSQKYVHSSADNRRKTSNSNRTQMTDIEFELATTDLLVSADCDTVIANTVNELAQSIVAITKAIANAPAKQMKRDLDDEAGFYMRGDNKNCISVDKNGVGVGRLWQQMLAVLPQSSLETSRAICAEYKTPLALFESLQSASTEEIIAQLADIGVSRAGGADARARRLGPEFARKLHTLFTATNGDQLIE